MNSLEIIYCLRRLFYFSIYNIASLLLHMVFVGIEYNSLVRSGSILAGHIFSLKVFKHVIFKAKHQNRNITQIISYERLTHCI